ncbi:MAG: tRNA (adenosine(37)-N6)-threonylcarbamoyltransferase complex dimerization subunit type 1 TsaB [Clostridia bacterium]|nr:tRNA (adenosine(37)-N6)-threonylcarbamoyltransferase complex dimerization subunit type 1 TsaB [Clostridia bacterium]
MKILAVDTSSILASATLLDGNEIVHKEDTNNVTHSERLLKLIDSVLKERNIKIKDLDYLMTTNGPGSFTGARIGCVTVKGLASAFDTKIISVSSIETMAFHTYLSLNTNEEKIICALLDAKNSRAYYGLFKFSKQNSKVSYSTLLDISNNTIEEIKEKIKEYTDVIITSDFPEIVNDYFKDLYGESGKYEANPNSLDVIYFFKNVTDEILKEHEKDAYTLDVIYARQSQAERMKNGEKD